MPTHKRYTVELRTDCRACAMAIAGHIPAAAKLRLVQVTDIDINEYGDVVGSIGCHINSPSIQGHDGSPMRCAEHGAAIDTSKEVGDLD